MIPGTVHSSIGVAVPTLYVGDLLPDIENGYADRDLRI